MSKPDLTAERARALFSYDKETGSLVWNARPVSDFSDARIASIWNARWAGKVAGWSDLDGYREVGIDNASFKVHRIAWLIVTGEWPENDIDHIDGDTGNNRFVNLRDVTIAVNNENRRRARSDSRTGLAGVHHHKASGLYNACIKVRGKKHSLGYYRTPDAAHEVYLAAKRRLHEGSTI